MSPLRFASEFSRRIGVPRGRRRWPLVAEPARDHGRCTLVALICKVPSWSECRALRRPPPTAGDLSLGKRFGFPLGRSRPVVFFAFGRLRLQPWPLVSERSGIFRAYHENLPLLGTVMIALPHDQGSSRQGWTPLHSSQCSLYCSVHCLRLGRHLQIVSCLQDQPEGWVHAKISPKLQCRAGTDRSLASQNLTHRDRCHSQINR